MPWKNGGGSTTEIAIAPAGASVSSGFDWRVSMADVVSDGPFSAFNGYDRQLALLSGGGMVLSGLPDGDITLRPGDRPLAFAGEAAITYYTGMTPGDWLSGPTPGFPGPETSFRK